MSRRIRGGSYRDNPPDLARLGIHMIRVSALHSNKEPFFGFRITSEEQNGQSSKSRDRTQSQYKDIHKSG